MLPPFKVCKVGVLPSMKLYTSWERFQLLKAGTRSSHWVRQRGLIELTPESAVLSPCRLETRRRGLSFSMPKEMQMQVQTPCFVPSWKLIPFPPVSPSHPSAPRCSHTERPMDIAGNADFMFFLNILQTAAMCSCFGCPWQWQMIFWEMLLIE